MPHPTRSIRLSPQDLARFSPEARAKITEAVEAAAPDVEGPVPAQVAPAQVAPAHAVRPNWSRRMAGVAVMAVLVGSGWAWVNRPQAGLLAGYGPVVDSTAPRTPLATPARAPLGTSSGSSKAAQGGGSVKQSAPVAANAPLAASTDATPPAVISGAQPAGTVVVPSCGAQLCQVPGTNVFAEPGTIYDPSTGQTRAIPTLSPGATRYYCRVEHVRHCPA